MIAFLKHLTKNKNNCFLYKRTLLTNRPYCTVYTFFKKHHNLRTPLPLYTCRINLKNWLMWLTVFTKSNVNIRVSITIFFNKMVVWKRTGNNCQVNVIKWFSPESLTLLNKVCDKKINCQFIPSPIWFCSEISTISLVLF